MPRKTRLSVHLHSNSIVASKFFRSGQRPFVEHRVLGAALPDLRLDQRERLDRPLHRRNVGAAGPRATSRTNVTCGRKVSRARAARSCVPAARRASRRRASAMPAALCCDQAEQARAPPELDPVKMQHKLATECQLLRRLAASTRARCVLREPHREKRAVTCRLRGGNRAAEGGVRLHVGAASSRADRVGRPQREEQAAVLSGG